jgi:hypothetical protein
MQNKEVEPLPNTIYKNSLKTDQGQKYKTQHYKLLGGNTVQNPHCIIIVNIFWLWRRQASKKKGQIGLQDIKKLCA